MDDQAKPFVATDFYRWGGIPHTLRYLLPALDKCLPADLNGVRVLDVGCGDGHLAGVLQKRGATVVGVDLDESGIASAREHYPEGRFEVLGADATVLERLNCEPFDIVLSTEVVEHLYDPRSFSRGCYSAVRPGGSFICSTPYHGKLKNLAVVAAGKFDFHFNPLWDGGHIKFWSRATLTQLLEETGFRDVHFVGAGRMPLLWMSMVLKGVRPA